MRWIKLNKSGQGGGCEKSTEVGKRGWDGEGKGGKEEDEASYGGGNKEVREVATVTLRTLRCDALKDVGFKTLLGGSWTKGYIE